ncbi:MAG: hypothetical protein K2J74_02580 [Muribaculaceae bacterium]|nr:hypothetical protein [Muribaculaceae bacterium]
MKQWIIGILLVLCSFKGFAQSDAYEEVKSISQEDQEMLAGLIRLVDEGKSDSAVANFDFLAKKYPKNYIVQYERLYNLYMLGKYDEVIKKKKFLLNHKYVNERAYQLIGNAYDLIGERNKAAEVYKDGIKHFPNSGSLYMELGTINLLNDEYNKALECYNRGILAQPDFVSNYYRAANLYFSSENGKVWGLIYAESAILLAPSNEERHEELAQWIIDCLKDNIKMSFEGEDTLSVRLAPSRDMKIDEKTNVVYVDFSGIYEGAIGAPLLKMLLEKEAFVGSLPQLIEIRKGLVETYFSVTDNLYGNSMYLLEFQKEVIDAGHWEAYNYFLFMHNFPEEFNAWYSADSAPLDAFIEWYNKAPYTLGDGRSVDPIQIYNNYRNIDLLQSLQIQAKLIIDKKSEDTTEE